MKDGTEGMLNGMGCIIGLVLVIPLSLYTGWVFTYLWHWFVFPIFGLPTPSFVLLAGLASTLKYATFVYRRPPKDENLLEAVIGSAVFSLLMGAMMLGLGFVLHRITA